MAVGARSPVREVAVVAAALLLPVPLLAAAAVHLPLPAAVERGLASVTPGGSFEAPVQQAAPSRPDTTAAEPSAGDGVDASSPGGEQASSSVVVPPDPDALGTEGGVGRAGRPQEGADERPAPLPPDTGSDDPPGEDSPDPPPPGSPPTEPDPPPASAASTEEPPGELAIGLDAGGVSTEVEAGSDGVDVTVSAGGLLPPTTLPVPPPLPLPLP
jgi:hypothetical protein